jgi:1,4-alpha-glucan branching enzyme
MTPVPRPGYRVPVPKDGSWREIINSDAQQYGGSGVGNFGAVVAQDGHVILTLPPLATIMLEHEQ